MTPRQLLAPLLDRCAAAAQQVYDQWEQDAEGNDVEYGSGGICDGIAEAMVDVLSTAGLEAGTVHYEQDNHTVAVAEIHGRFYEVDIPLGLYERGGWYNYQKISGVHFTARDVEVVELPESPFDSQ